MVGISYAALLLEFTRLGIMSLAFVVALYAFFAKEPRLREGAERLLAVIFLLGISAVASTVALVATHSGPNKYEGYFAATALTLFISGWVILLAGFWRLYGHIYHMRERRFLKYVAPFRWLYSLRSKRWAKNSRDRRTFSLPYFQLTDIECAQMFRGGTILIRGGCDVDLSRIAIAVLADGLVAGETGDYVCCQRPPSVIWDAMRRQFPSLEEAGALRPSFIDAFSPNYGFDDEILKEELASLREIGGYGLNVITAKTIPGIHTAGNTSWYMNKKKLTGAGAMLRPPHRTVYDRLSALTVFSGSEQIKNFMHHFSAAERAYRMLSIIVESDAAPKEIMETATDLADCVVDFRREAGVLRGRILKAPWPDLPTDRGEVALSPPATTTGH